MPISENSITNANLAHIPVMLGEMLRFLQPKDDQAYLDATFGAGGYSKAILGAADCNVTAVDRDPSAENFAAPLKNYWPRNFSFCKSDFAGYAASCQPASFDGVIADLGVSTMQLSDPSRGFSFAADGPLDMSMEQNNNKASELVNSAGEQEIADILFNFGGERQSRRIAKAIACARAKEEIKTTGMLADIIRSAIKGARGKIDPATRSFQAIRIYVNDELEQIRQLLSGIRNILKPGGRIVIVSFHSLEDQIVKEFFKNNSAKKIARSKYAPAPELKDNEWLEIITKKPAEPSREEIMRNRSARSAKLRAARKIRP